MKTTYTFTSAEERNDFIVKLYNEGKKYSYYKKKDGTLTVVIDE